MSDVSKISLLGMDKAQIAALIPDMPKFTASQIYGFLMDGKDFDEMTSLKKEYREYLKEHYVANPVSILEVFQGKLGTKKYLFRLDDQLIEGVYMPHDYGNTLCLSTQIGCRMGCTFCASTLDGLVRNLTPAEMLGQVIAVNRDNGGTAKTRAVTNLVLMGSGEPFDNYDNVLEFLDEVSKEGGINISERNISLSTSGLCDKIRKFADSGHKVTLSISLHAPFDDLRSALMPVNKAYGVKQLVDCAKYYLKNGKTRDFRVHAHKRRKRFRRLRKRTRSAHERFSVSRQSYTAQRSQRARSRSAECRRYGRFSQKLEKLGVSATIRKSLGNDIEGACGQLRRRYLKENGEISEKKD